MMCGDLRTPTASEAGSTLKTFKNTSHVDSCPSPEFSADGLRAREALTAAQWRRVWKKSHASRATCERGVAKCRQMERSRPVSSRVRSRRA
eukprot:6182431-Pleurochrysis_carterae.AAC.6